MVDETQTEKKKRVIHTRVPESLDKELKQKASKLGVSVSNLVRNVLLNTFGLVEDIVSDSQRIADSAGLSSPGREVPRSEVIGWQELVLNLNAVCSVCNSVLKKGARAAIGVTGGNPPVLCLDCLKEFQSDDS